MVLQVCWLNRTTKKERQDYVDIMQENTELLLQLISDILDLSKIEAETLDFTMNHLDINSFCEDIMRNYDIKEDKPVPVAGYGFT